MSVFFNCAAFKFLKVLTLNENPNSGNKFKDLTRTLKMDCMKKMKKKVSEKPIDRFTSTGDIFDAKQV
jgi:hypothetical protein